MNELKEEKTPLVLHQEKEGTLKYLTSRKTIDIIENCWNCKMKRGTTQW